MDISDEVMSYFGVCWSSVSGGRVDVSDAVMSYFLIKRERRQGGHQ